MLSSFAIKSKSTPKRASSNKSKRLSCSIWSSSSCGGASACFGLLSSTTSVESQVIVLDPQSNHEQKPSSTIISTTTTTPTKQGTNDDEARAASPSTCATQPTTTSTTSSSSPLSFQDLFSFDSDDSSSSSSNNSSSEDEPSFALQEADDLMILQEFCRIKSPFLLKLEQVNWERKQQHSEQKSLTAPSLAQELQRIQSEQQERWDHETNGTTTTRSILTTKHPDSTPLEEESSSTSSSSSESSNSHNNNHNYNDDDYNPQFIPKPTTNQEEIVGMEFNVISDHNSGVVGEQELLLHANLQRLIQLSTSSPSTLDWNLVDNEAAGATTTSSLLSIDDNTMREDDAMTIMDMKEDAQDDSCLLQTSTAGTIQQQGDDGTSSFTETEPDNDEIEIVFYRDGTETEDDIDDDTIHALENASSPDVFAQDDDDDEVILWELAADNEESCLEHDLDGSFYTSRQETSTVRSGTSSSSTLFLDAHETLSASFVSSSTASIGSPAKKGGRSSRQHDELPTTTDKTTTTVIAVPRMIPKQLSMSATEQQEQQPPPYQWYHPDHVDVPQDTLHKHSVHEFLRRRQAQQEQEQKEELAIQTNCQGDKILPSDADDEDEIRSWCGVSTGSCPSSAVQTLVQLCSNSTPQTSSKSQPQSPPPAPTSITWWSILQLHGENTAAAP